MIRDLRMKTCTPQEQVMKEEIFSACSETSSQVGGNFRTSEGAYSSGFSEDKWRDSTIEFVCQTGLPTLKEVADRPVPTTEKEAECWGSVLGVRSQRERAVVGCCKDTLRGLVQHSWVSQRSKGHSKFTIGHKNQPKPVWAVAAGLDMTAVYDPRVWNISHQSSYSQAVSRQGVTAHMARSLSNLAVLRAPWTGARSFGRAHDLPQTVTTSSVSLPPGTPHNPSCSLSYPFLPNSS